MSTPPALAQVAGAFHALSDPTRLKIVHLLRHGERCVCDLAKALATGQSRLSFHLRTLKEAGLVRDRREGRWVYYRLADDAVRRLSALLGDCCVPDRPWLPSRWPR